MTLNIGAPLNEDYLKEKKKLGRPFKIKKSEKDTCETTMFAAENPEGEIL